MRLTPVSCVAREYRRLYRRRAAPARQQRGMHVEAAFRRDIENVLRKNKPVSRHDEDIRIECRDLRHGIRVLEGHRLQHLDTVVEGEPFDRARGKPLAAPGRAVRLRQYRERRDARIRQRLQRRERKFRRTGKQHSCIGHDGISASGGRRSRDHRGGLVAPLFLELLANA